jgi:tetratricopeptide (TPR) repeat protein
MTEAAKNDSLAGAGRNTLLWRIGRWYDQRLGRADLGLMAFQQILATEPAHEGASEGMCAIYRRAQQWPELAMLLMKRADAAATTPRARDFRVEAAELLESKLNNPQQARDIYAAVVAEDPGHPKASEALARIAERTGDFQTLAKILERRAESRRGREKAEALVRVAEVYEDHLNDLGEATRRYEAVLALDNTNVDALKGLERIYSRSGQYRELLEVLDRHVAVAATPRQKINLFERMGALYDEEFLDHERAAWCCERILEIDPTNDGALTSLARHYRALDRWEPLVKLLERHAQTTGDDHRRVELLVQRARTLADNIGSPERAIKAFEQVLEKQPGHAGALEALSQLREISGDVHAALSAIEALAAKATTPEAKAEQWMRAARLLESRGDKDGAIERYKLALDANPKDAAASAALRKAYGQRGDAASVVGLIERELAFAEGDLAKARLHAEQARVFYTQLKDARRAETAAKRALDLDGTNAEALMVLGDMAYEAGRMLEATKLYEQIVGRTGILPQEDASRVLVQYIEAFGKSTGRPSQLPQPSQADVGASGAPPASAGRISVAPPAQTNPKLTSAIDALRQLAPDNVEAQLRAANVLFEFGDPRAARKMCEDLLARFGSKLHGADRAELLYHLGESARRMGDLDEAVMPLQAAADADPGNPKPLRSLARIYEDRGDWEKAIKTKRRRLDVATGAERFDLLLEIGDIELQKLGDRTRAGKTYVAALEERPDDRKLLTKLMQLYSEEKDWGKVVDVVLRLADFVDDKKQRAKYMHTAATIAARHLNETDQALKYYDRALELDPTLTKALEEATEIHRQKGQHADVERLLNHQLDQAKAAGDRAKIVKTLDQLGELYRKFLNDPDLAVDAYEAAQAFDPEDRARAETLAELYASDVTKYLDKAVKAQAQILRRNPYKVESYKLLRKLYTEAKKADPAWCLCQVLSVLNLAEPDEERFYRKHKADNAAPAQAALSEDDWNRLAHPDMDALVTKIFAMVQPTIIRTRTQPLEALGYDPRYAIDTSLHPYPVSQTLYYVQGVLGIPAPLVFQNPNDPAGLGFLHAQTPAIVLGRAAFDTQVPTQSLAFLAGRHMTYFRPGYYVRHLVPTGTGLKAWLFAAIRMSVPQFPVTPDLQQQVNEAMQAMAPDFQGMHKEKLASLVSKLLQAGSAIDLKKWVAAIDLTADRAGFVLAHDLGVATEVIRATGEEAASIPVKERMKEIVLFGVSEEYFAIREKLQIAVDS